MRHCFEGKSKFGCFHERGRRFSMFGNDGSASNLLANGSCKRLFQAVHRREEKAAVVGDKALV